MTSLLEHRRQFALEVVERLRRAGHEALWAGGCVRDLLLERAPTDYDVATSARPEQVRELFGFRRTLAVGAAFGVVIVKGRDGQDGQVEVATFRNDAQYSDGRRPDSVTFSTAQDDAARRDFTINGMFYDPLAGRVIDYVGGQDDLARGLIRAIGNAEARIAEDKLRMLRAVRFAARFHFAIESATEAALARHAAELSLVSGERMTAEMCKTLETSGREFALRTWASTGLLRMLLPRLAARWQAVGQRACALLRAVDPQPWTAALAACLWPLVGCDGGPGEGSVGDASGMLSEMLADFKARLKFSNEELAQLKFAIESQLPFSQADQLRWSELQPLLVQRELPAATALLRARVDCGEVAVESLRKIEECLKWPSERLNPSPLIDGQILRSLGLQPGPQFKELLTNVRQRQLDGLLQDQEEAIRWIKTRGIGF